MTVTAREIRVQTQPRRGLRRLEAASYVGVSPSKFDEMVDLGTMPTPKQIGRVRVWDRLELDIYFDTLPQDVPNSDDRWA